MKTSSNNGSETQNVTLSLPRKLLRKAKLHAVVHETSLSQLMRDALLAILGEKETYDDARKRQVQRMNQLDLGLAGKISWKRDDLYE